MNLLFSSLHYSAFTELLKQRKEDKDKNNSMNIQLDSSLDDMKGIDIGLPCVRFHKLPHKVGWLVLTDVIYF